MADTPGRVHLLMFRADGLGGVARTVINLANELVKERPVEIISLYRVSRERSYWIDPRIEVTWLLSRTPREGMRVRPGRQPSRSKQWELDLDQLPTTLAPAGAEGPEVMSAYTDHVLAEKIGSIQSGVLVSTRPTLHVAAVRHARPGVTVIGQDHGNFIRRSHNPAVMHALGEAVPRLDSYVVLTEGDELDYRAWAPTGSRIDRIPNGSTTPPDDRPGPLVEKVVISAGRFVREKGFDRLAEAWEPLATEFPDWQLHLYGSGPAEDVIREAIEENGVGEQVIVKGFSHAFEEVLAGASAYAMGSRTEGFPMVLVEAMGKGLPLVAFDCPRGPADLIEDGVNGHLVPDGDIAGFTEALRALITDAEQRRKMGAASLERARGYEMSSIASRWTALFEELEADDEDRAKGARDDVDEATDSAQVSGQRPRATVVVVAGSGRSGTSTIAGVLKTIGLAVPPPEVEADNTNPRGYFEPQWAVDFQSRLLRQSTARLTDARPVAFEATEQVARRDETRRVVGAWLRGHARPGVELVVKDPRSSWFLPMWRQAAADADAGIAFLTMLRHPAEVVGSKDHYYKAAHVGDTPRHAQTRGTASWINIALFTEYSTRDAPRTFVRYNDLLADWRAVVAQVSTDLGLRAAQEIDDDTVGRVDDFVDPGLRRIRTEWHQVDCPDSVRDLAQEVWEQLGVLADNGGSDEAAERRLDECRHRYQEMYTDAEALAQSSIEAAADKARRAARRRARGAPPEKSADPSPGRRVASAVLRRLRRA